MHAAAMMTVGAGDVGGGALSVVQVHCSSDTKQSAYKVAAAEKAKPRRTDGRRKGRAEGNSAQCDREKEKEIGWEEDRRSERITALSEGEYCLHRANQNQPFQHTLPLLAPSRTNTQMNAGAYAQAIRTYTLIHTHDSI